MARRRRKVGLIIAGALMLAGAGGIWWVMKVNGSPSVGHIVDTPVFTKQNPADDIPKTFSGKYIEVSYPPTYKQGGVQLTGNRLEMVSLTGPEHQNFTLSISPSPGSLDEDSSVRLRRQETTQYKEQAWQLNGDTGVIFTTTSGDYEKTAFIIHGAYEATASFSDPLNKDASHDFENIINNLSWNQ